MIKYRNNGQHLEIQEYNELELSINCKHDLFHVAFMHTPSILPALTSKQR